MHALLAQEVSALDFCFLWQELAAEKAALAPMDRQVRRFLETAELGFLDRALALLPPPPADRSSSLLEPEGYHGVDWRGDWHLDAKRIRDTTYLDLRCLYCGFEMTLASEHSWNSELRLPFDEMDCPLCEGSPPVERPSHSTRGETDDRRTASA